MNKILIIGNLTRDPETGTTKEGVNWCRFSLAVNRRQRDDAQFMRVTAWRGLADSCARYLAKGRKAAVVGDADVYAWLGRDGAPRAQLEITAQDVEFLTPRSQYDQVPETPPGGPEGGYVEADDEVPNY